MRFLILVAVLAQAMFPACAGEERLDPADQWGQWRGPLGTGVAPRADPPIEWSEERNVRWKVEIPGLGHSSPVVWGDRIFITTAIPVGEALPAPTEHAPGAHHNVSASHRQRFAVLAIDRRDGSTLWQRIVREGRPHEGTHETGTWASNSAVTDGERVYAFFGSSGLYCLNVNGELLWDKDLGEMATKHGHGEGSSPALHGDTLVVNWDHEDDSFLIALDKRTGKLRWRVTREEGSSWSTPLIVSVQGKSQVIVAATRRVRAYDLANGELIWECGGLSGNVVASPVAADGFVYVANSYETRNLLAIRLAGAHGDITGTGAVVWTRHRDTPYVPSPVLYDDTLCFLKHYQAVVTCVEARSGKPFFGPERIDGIRNVFASLVGAAGRIYIVDRNGSAVVMRRGERFEILARNSLEGSFSASPAIVGDEIFLRGERYLYCIGRETDSGP